MVNKKELNKCGEAWHKLYAKDKQDALDRCPCVSEMIRFDIYMKHKKKYCYLEDNPYNDPKCHYCCRMFFDSICSKSNNKSW